MKGHTGAKRMKTLEIAHKILYSLENKGEVRFAIKDAEYLRDNSTMQKIAKVMTDVITIAKP